MNEIEQLKISISKREKLLSNENYTSKAPEKVVEAERNKLKEEQDKLEILKQKL